MAFLGAASGQTPVNDAIVEKAIAKQTQLFLPIPLDEQLWLKKIQASKQAELKDRQRVLALARLLNSKSVMNYRNGDSWYTVHPLLASELKTD